MRLAKQSIRLFVALLCAVVVVCGSIVWVPVAYGDDEPQTLTVGVPNDRCPVFYEDPNTGELVGIGVDLMRSVAEDVGYEVEFKVTKEPSLKEALDNPEYDVIMPFGSAITSASGAPSIVTENLMQTPFTLVTEGKGELPPINRMRVGMLKSLAGGAETVRQLYPGIEISMYETMPECVKALRDGKVDALLHNSYVWSYVLQKPAYADLRVQPFNMFSMDFRAGTLDTPKGRAIVERLNKGIESLNDTRREAFVLDYTSRRLYRYDLGDYIYLYGVFILFGVLLLVAVIIISLQRRRTLRLAREEEMRRLIDHDPLTGALSAHGFRKRVEELMRTYPDTQYLLSYSNIRNFKFINDSLDREAGDDLLRFWVQRTIGTLSEKEAIGRVEADHIAVLRGMGGDEQMAQDAIDVFEPLRNFFVDQGKEYRIQTCTGVYVVTPEDYKTIDVDHMLDCARVAERRMREGHANGYEFYNPDQWERGRRTAQISSHLPTAMQSGELRVWYQPQVDYQSGRIDGAEALCRWQHDELGWISPGEFIPILEDSDLIYELDCFVWQRVCEDLRRWKDQGKVWSASVNLSRRDIERNPDVPQYLHDLVKEHGLTPEQLRIEITETAYVNNPDLLITTTNALHKLGFLVEMDDFGSGYSSLHMLKEMPVDCIKLDLHFLTGMGDPKKGRVILSHVIQMINSLGVGLIAEGVETAEQATFLLDQGCSRMQGYYFYKPIPVQDFEALLDE